MEDNNLKYKHRLEHIYSIKDMHLKKLLLFYLQTSTYTYLGPYADFVRNLPDDIEQLCVLQRMQTIHPIVFSLDKNIKNDSENALGDMTKIPLDRFNNEEDIYQTAISIFSELLRRYETYSIKRPANKKIHIVCRGNALMLASTLKAKGIPARIRVGFAKYHYIDGKCDDQWITEYYDINKNKWIMVDSSGIGGNTTIPNQILDIPKNEFFTSADAWLKLRNNSMPAKIKLVDAGGYTGLKAAWLQLMNDFNSLMNNEKSFLFQPVYMYDCKNNHYYIRDFTDNELIELDNLATLMLDCDNNLEKLYKIYKENPKFKIMLGISTWN